MLNPIKPEIDLEGKKGGGKGKKTQKREGKKRKKEGKQKEGKKEERFRIPKLWILPTYPMVDFMT